MNAIVENTPTTHFEIFNKKEIREIQEEFLSILSLIVNSTTEEQLREIFSKYPLDYFMIGFGGSHMWVKQLINGESKQQVIMVKFE